ncbi:NADP-dependent oxidoreductase [Amycolatopsis anabasis]|uniref:NADP-dependent oxidoreductase n=1 Tax=Amycolatopsis anabasis TaxID=1840409 RepID=UPI00131AA3B3|nr:NADP-dependent oxidoreductase [Amycolatopsis anabasis]
MSNWLTGREIRLVRRPGPVVQPDDFAVTEGRVPSPGPGEVVVRNKYLSLEAGMRAQMSDLGVKVPRYELGEPMTGRAVGEVVTSGSDELHPGDVVVHQFGWREYAVAAAARFTKIDPSARPRLTDFLSTGLIAYFGLLDAARMRPGDVVFVSSAAGAVGSLAGQIARLKGAARVIGSAGSARKVEFLTRTLGFDAGFDYHDGPVVDRLRELAPDGVDVYFDNTGGPQLEAALEVLRPFGRIALCGALVQFTGGSGAGPRNLMAAVEKSLTLRGFTGHEYAARQAEYLADYEQWLRAGKLINAETVVEGLPAAIDAFIGMLAGKHVGKLVVDVG